MTKNEFALAFNEVLEEKQLSKDIVLGAIESAMVSAYRRAVNASTAQQVEAKVDAETGRVTVFAEKEVVEEVQEINTEVTLEEARKVNPEAQLGDMVIVESTPADFGRVRGADRASSDPTAHPRSRTLGPDGIFRPTSRRDCQWCNPSQQRTRRNDWSRHEG